MAVGISVSNTSNLSSGQRILVNAAKVAFPPAQPDPDLIWNQEIPQGHKQWDILTYARLSQASALTEGVDLAQSQQLVAASLSVTPTEHGIIATLSKRLIRRQGDAPVFSQTGTQLAESQRRRMANDVRALYDGFTKSTPGASVAIDITHFRGSAAYLMTDNDSAYGPAPLPYRAVLHAEQLSDIIVDISDTAPRGTTTGLTDSLLQRWWRGRDRLYGIEAFHSALDRDTDGDSKGTIMAEEALVLVHAGETEVTEEDDKSLRAIEVGIFQEWSEAERADPHGVEIYSDSSATI
tara:strand:+ start:10427 stop:11308 length:882 start_codon:yes stop_codon:yes gene_type:complete